MHGQIGLQQDTSRRCQQACVLCAKAKQRCEGGLPCARCLRKNFVCEYGQLRPTGKASISPLPHVETSPSVDALTIDVLPSESGNTSVRQTHDSSQGSLTITQLLDSSPQTPLQQAIHTPPLAESTGLEPWESSLRDQALFVNTPTQSPLDANSTDWDIEFSLDTNCFVNTLDPAELPFLEEGTIATGFPFLSMLDDFVYPFEHPHSIEAVGKPGAYRSMEDSQTSNETENELSTIPENRRQPLDRHSMTVPSYHTSSTSCTYQVQTCPEFPATGSVDLQMAGAEIFGHVKKISVNCFETIHTFYVEQRHCKNSPFISMEVFHAFVELYFEYFDFQFPFLHHSRMDADEPSWILLLAVAAVGSQYSEIKDAHRYSVVLQELLKRATEPHARLYPLSFLNQLIECQVRLQSKSTDITIVQSIFLRHVGLLFSASKRDLTMLQYERNILVTLCRTLVCENDSTQVDQHHNDSVPNKERLYWLSAEENIRLLHCVYGKFKLQSHY